MALKRILIVAVVTVVIVTIISSVFIYLYQQPTTKTLEPLTVGIFANDVNALIYLANNQSFFENNGLNVTIKEYGSGLLALNGMLNGESDISTAAEFVLAEKAIDNESIYTFGSNCQALYFSVIARTDRGINDISNLKGKTIGVALGTNAQFYLGRFLELNNINQSEVSLVNIPFAQSQYALENGVVDAVIPPEPYAYQIKSEMGNNVVVWPAQEGQPFYFDLICTRSWGSNNPELIKGFLLALIQAQDFYSNNRQEAQVIVAQKLNYTTSYIESVWSGFDFSVSLDQAQLLAMQDEARWLIANRLINSTQVPNFLDFIDSAPLMQIKPDAVTIIH